MQQATFLLRSRKKGPIGLKEWEKVGSACASDQSLIFLWILGNLKNDIQADLSIYSAYIMSFQIKFALSLFGTFSGQATLLFLFLPPIP